MKRASLTILVALLAVPLGAWSDDLTTDAAIGGGVGGAVGGAIGAQVGDREGAIIGSAVGAAVGTAIATEGESDHGHSGIPAGEVTSTHIKQHPHTHHCPPGQAKKGRC